MIIDGLAWFIGALCICGIHALFLLDWRRESRERIKQWGEYEESSERRHREFMVALAAARSPLPPGEGKA